MPLSHYADLNTRICRPVGLSPEDLRKVIEFAVSRIGEPTRAICSTLIAQAYESVRYPILPLYVPLQAGEHAKDAYEELLRIRHYSLFAPRDFDISPYFAIIKPTLMHGFDYQKLHWVKDAIRYESE